MTQRQIGFLAHRGQPTSDPALVPPSAHKVAPVAPRAVRVNPDPRFLSFIQMVMSAAPLGVYLEPTALVFTTSTGSIQVTSSSDLHIVYIAPFPEEQPLELFAGCKAPGVQPGEPGFVNAVSPETEGGEILEKQEEVFGEDS